MPALLTLRAPVPDGFLAFEVDVDAPVAEAVLILGAAPDRPVRLPLTGDVPEPAFPVELTVSGTADGTGPTNGGTIRFELLGAPRTCWMAEAVTVRRSSHRRTESMRWPPLASPPSSGARSLRPAWCVRNSAFCQVVICRH